MLLSKLSCIRHRPAASPLASIGLLRSRPQLRNRIQMRGQRHADALVCHAIRDPPNEQPFDDDDEEFLEDEEGAMEDDLNGEEGEYDEYEEPTPEMLAGIQGISLSAVSLCPLLIDADTIMPCRVSGLRGGRR